MDPASVCRPSFHIFFSSETAWPIKAKFYVEPPWVGGTKVYINGPGHMTKMATIDIVWACFRNDMELHLSIVLRIQGLSKGMVCCPHNACYFLLNPFAIFHIRIRAMTSSCLSKSAVAKK